MKPKGELKIIGTNVKQKGDVAVYVKIWLEDEDKKIFSMEASNFLFDLKEEE